MDGFYAKYISVSNILKIPSLIIAFDLRRAYPANLPKVVVSLGWGNEWKVLFVFFVKFPFNTERMEFWFILFRRCALKGEISESVVSMDGYCTKYISEQYSWNSLFDDWCSLSSFSSCSLTQGGGVVGFDGVAKGELNKEFMVGDST